MAKFNHLTNNFQTGEFGPKMVARTDLEEYKTSCERIMNMFPLKQGGLTRRSGSKKIDDLVLGANGLRTIPFVFSKEEAYIITLDPKALPPVPATITDDFNQIADYNVPENNHSMLASDFISIIRNDGTAATVTGDLGNPNTIAYDTSLTEAGVISFGLTWYRPYAPEIFNLVDIDPVGFHFAQSADIMVLTHSSGNIPPMIIARTGLDTFEVDWYHRYNLREYVQTRETRYYYPNVLRVPFDRPNITQVAFRGTHVATHRYYSTLNLGGGDVIAIDKGDVNLYDIFDIQSNIPYFTDNSFVGQTYKMEVLKGVELITIDFLIVEVVSDTEVKAITPRYFSGSQQFDGPNNPPSPAQNFEYTDNWRKSSWGGGSGYPKTVCFFEQRLVFGGTNKDVDTIWATRTGNIYVLMAERFSQDSTTDETGLRNFISADIPDKDKIVDIFGSVNLATDPLSFKPSSQEINAIQWLSSGQSLMMGTLGAEYVVSGADSALSATSITYRRQTSRGGSPIMPVRIDDEVMYILRDGRSAYNFKFNRNNGSFLSNEVTLHADHIVDVGDDTTIAQFKQVEYCTSRDVVLCLTTDKYLVGLTYNPQNKTMAWHRYDFNGDVLSMASIPSVAGDLDEIWVAIERNGVRTLEKVGHDFRAKTLNDPDNPSLFLDGHQAYTNILAPTTVFAPHLEGLDVELYVDGYFSSAFTMTNAGIEIPICTTAIVGLPYKAFVEGNDLNAGGEFGTSKGLTQRIDRVSLVFYKSINANGGHTNGKLDPIKNLDGVLATGTYPLDFPYGPAEDGAKVKVESNGAFPLTILGIIARGQTHDR